MNYHQILSDALNLPFVSAGTRHGSGSVYISFPSNIWKEVRKAGIQLGMPAYKKMGGTYGNVLDLGYDNANGSLISKGEVMVAFLKQSGVDCDLCLVGD